MNEDEAEQPNSSIKSSEESNEPVNVEETTDKYSSKLETKDFQSENAKALLKYEEKVDLKRIDPNTFRLIHSFGFQSHKRSNIHFVEDNLVVSSIGNILIFLNLDSATQYYTQGISNGSIGAICVHPSKRYIAVAENAEAEPNIYIYSYPSMSIVRVLKGGAERGYSDISFNSQGTKLASVAADPDYMLTIWNWRDETIMLRSKAFSQDVFRVSFSQENDGILTTSGMGHIKFWRMSSTFTGLKLQGYIGKFGASELSDIASFMQLPDGKVLSSTETGNLLLWDGGMIKCEIGVKGKKPCHQGHIEVILLGEGEIITGGEDGFVRVWDLETIDNADVVSASGESSSSVSNPRVFEMEPIDEILIAKDVKIKSIIRFPNTTHDYLVQDQQGYLMKLDLHKRTNEKILSFHSGAVAGVSTSPLKHQMSSLGKDGNLHVYDYVGRSTVNKAHYPQGGSFISYIPANLDAMGSTVALGFVDGVIRIVSTISTGFIVQYVLKPHKKAINQIYFTNDGKYMITASEDGTIFLFNLDFKKDSNGKITLPFTKSSVAISPIGFLTFDSAVKSISQINFQEQLSTGGKKAPTTQGRRLILNLSTGELFTLFIPNDFSFDSMTTYEISHAALKVESWKYKIPEKLVKEEAKIEEKQEEESGENALEKKTASKSLLMSKNNLSLSVESLKKQKGLLLNGSELNYTAFYGLEDGFFLCSVMNEEMESELRISNFANPSWSKLITTIRGKVINMRPDITNQFVFLGTNNGASVVIRFEFAKYELKSNHLVDLHESYAEYSKNMENLIQQTLITLKPEMPELNIKNPPWSIVINGQVWVGHLHDIVVGSVSSMTMSYDQSFLISSGADGGIFLWRNSTVEIEKESELDNFDEHLNQFVQPDDISDPNSYSIQEAKLKSEKDKEIEQAELRKQIIRNQIQELRVEFNAIIVENENSPASKKLDRSEICVDLFLRQDIEKLAKEKEETLYKEMAWISEKESIGPKKLFRKFLEPLQTERIEIKAFQTMASVATFRTLKLGQQLENILQPVTNQNEKQNNKVETAAENNEKPQTVAENKQDQAAANSKHNTKKIKKLEARKQLRAERTAIWKQLMDSKPDDKYQDPKDVAAIRHAINHMGDYKLKTAANYIVPESERVDADKKKRQIMLLNESIKNLKEQFNEKVLNLRTKKVQLAELIIKSNEKLKDLNQKLAALGETSTFTAYQPEIEERCFPENRNIITDADIAQLQKEELENASTNKSKGDDPMGFGNGSKEGKPAQKANAPKADSINTTEQPTAVPEPKLPVEAAKKVGTPDQEMTETKIKIIQLKYEKSNLIQEIESGIKRFDKMIALVAKERLMLAADLKFADIKIQLLFREWMLLKEFEQTDNALAEKLNAKKAEKNEIDAKIAEYREKLNSKKVEIEAVIQKEREIHDEYKKMIGENNKNEEFLTKVFKRKVKRAKKKAKEGSEEDEDMEDEDEDSESDASSYNSEDTQDEEFEEVCPPECDPNLWTKVLEIRERRLDQEEFLVEVQKAVEALKKENDSLIKKEKIIDVGLKNAEAEIQEFQTQKQRKLNELDVVVPLKFSQIQYLENDHFPKDMSSCLVFYNEGLIQLKRRIKELHQEKADIKKQHRELRKHHVSFNKSRKEKQQKVAELSERARDVQMLKFGQIVDLEKLERLSVNKTADELKEKLQKEDLRRLKEVAEVDHKIRDEKEKLISVIKENTNKLENLVDLQRQKSNLEKALNVSQTVVNTDLSGQQKKDIEERERLIRLVQTQAQQIEAVKEEIENLIRKPISRQFTKQPNHAQVPITKPEPLPDINETNEDSIGFPETEITDNQTNNGMAV
ncbi:Cilia- and flagella-associated protein 44 [Boothiomyces sp. JEL0866]|nr:Cilia- and flagella-associated protein 44 [Boothiomyces sp. JEL0866]